MVSTQNEKNKSKSAGSKSLPSIATDSAAHHLTSQYNQPKHQPSTSFNQSEAKIHPLAYHSAWLNMNTNNCHTMATKIPLFSFLSYHSIKSGSTHALTYRHSILVRWPFASSHIPPIEPTTTGRPAQLKPTIRPKTHKRSPMLNVNGVGPEMASILLYTHT